MKIEILNTSILTSEGTYKMEPISLEIATSIVRAASAIEGYVLPYAIRHHVGIESAVGHEATAAILTELLGVSVPMNRIQFRQAESQSAIVFKIRGRIPEGTVLDREQIDAIGYEFFLLTRLQDIGPHVISRADEERGHHMKCLACGAQDPDHGTLKYLPCEGEVQRATVSSRA